MSKKHIVEHVSGSIVGHRTPEDVAVEINEFYDRMTDIGGFVLGGYVIQESKPIPEVRIDGDLQAYASTPVSNLFLIGEYEDHTE